MTGPRTSPPLRPSLVATRTAPTPTTNWSCFHSKSRPTRAILCRDGTVQTRWRGVRALPERRRGRLAGARPAAPWQPGRTHRRQRRWPRAWRPGHGHRPGGRASAEPVPVHSDADSACRREIHRAAAPHDRTQRGGVRRSEICAESRPAVGGSHAAARLAVSPGNTRHRIEREPALCRGACQAAPARASGKRVEGRHRPGRRTRRRSAAQYGAGPGRRGAGPRPALRTGGSDRDAHDPRRHFGSRCQNGGRSGRTGRTGGRSSRPAASRHERIRTESQRQPEDF